MDLFPVVEEVFEPNRFLVILSVIIFFSALVLWPLGWLFRLPKMNKPGAVIPKYRPFFTLARYFTLLLVVLSLVFYFFIRQHAELINQIAFQGLSPDAGLGYKLLMGIPTLLSILLMVQALLLIPVWTQKHGTKIFRIQYSLVVLALLVYFTFLVSWNLVVPAFYLENLL